MSDITSQLKVMITGASDGIGLETARQYVAEGARVLLVSRGIQKLRATVDSLGQSVEVAAVDLTDRTALDTLLRSLDARGYTPDVLVNNAGQGLSGPFADSDWSHVASMLELNMVALTRLTHWAAGRMKAAGRGAIVNVSAAVATRPVPWFAAYAASKAFVTNLSQALDIWQFTIDGSSVEVPINSRMVVTTTEAAVDAAISGVGLTQVPWYQIAEAHQAGQLDLVLGEFERIVPISLIYNPSARPALKLRAFLDFVGPRLRDQLARIDSPGRTTP